MMQSETFTYQFLLRRSFEPFDFTAFFLLLTMMTFAPAENPYLKRKKAGLLQPSLFDQVLFLFWKGIIGYPTFPSDRSR